MTAALILCSLLATTLSSGSIGKFWNLHGWYPSSLSSSMTPGSDDFVSCGHAKLDKASASAFYSILDSYDVRKHFFSQGTNAVTRKDAVRYVGNYASMKKVFDAMRAIPSFQTKGYRSFVGSSLLDYVVKEVDGDISYRFHDWMDLPCGGYVNWNSFPCLDDLPENEGSLYSAAGHAGNLTAMVVSPLFVSQGSTVDTYGNGLTPTFEKVMDMAYSHTNLGETYDPNRPIRWAPLENAAQVVGMQDKVLQVFLRDDVACVTNMTHASFGVTHRYGGTCECARLLSDGTVEIIEGYETYHLPAVHIGTTTNSFVTNVSCSIESPRIRVDTPTPSYSISASCVIGYSELDMEDFDFSIMDQIEEAGADPEGEFVLFQCAGIGVSSIIWQQGDKEGSVTVYVYDNITEPAGPLEMNISGHLSSSYTVDEAVANTPYSVAFGDKPYRPNVQGVSMETTACEFSSFVARKRRNGYDPFDAYRFSEDVYITSRDFYDGYDIVAYESASNKSENAIMNLYEESNSSIASEISRFKSDFGIGDYNRPAEFSGIESSDMGAIIATTDELSCSIEHTSHSYGVNTGTVVRTVSQGGVVEWVVVNGTFEKSWNINAKVTPSVEIPSSVYEKISDGFVLDTRRTFLADSKVTFPSLDIQRVGTNGTICISNIESVRDGQLAEKFSGFNRIECVSGDDPVFDVGVSGFERAFTCMPNLLKASFSMCTNCDDRAFYGAFSGCPLLHSANFAALKRAGDDAFNSAFVGCGKFLTMDCAFTNLTMCGDRAFQSAFPATRSEFVNFKRLKTCGDQTFDSAYRDASFMKENACVYFNALEECGDWAFASAFSENDGQSVTLVKSFLNEEGNAYTNKFAVAGYLDGYTGDDFTIKLGQFTTNCTVTTWKRTERGIPFIAVCTLASEGVYDLKTLLESHNAYLYSESRPSVKYQAPDLSGWEVYASASALKRNHPVYDDYCVVTNLHVTWACETLPEEFGMCDANIAISVFGNGYSINLSNASPLSTITNITGTAIGEFRFSAFGTNTSDIVTIDMPIPYDFGSGTAWSRKSGKVASFPSMVSWWTPFGYRKYTW